MSGLVWEGDVVLCLCVVSLDSLWRWQVQVSCILCYVNTCTSYLHPVFNRVVPDQYLLPNMYLSVADIANPDLFLCCCRTGISFRHRPLL